MKDSTAMPGGLMEGKRIEVEGKKEGIEEVVY